VSLFCFVWLVWLGGVEACARRSRSGSNSRKVSFEVNPENPDAGDHGPFLIFLGFVIFYGVQVAESQRSAVYDILPFSRAILYAVAPVCGVLMVISLVRVLTRQIQRYSPRRKDGNKGVAEWICSSSSGAWVY